MSTINRQVINICTSNLEKSTVFYTQLFDFEVNFASDWFVQMVSKDQGLELGLIDVNNELVPKEYQKTPSGFYITFVVNSADEIFDRARDLSITIVRAPEDTFYGQRRLLLQDPNGALIDVSSLIPNFQF